MKKNRKRKTLCVIGITAAALATGAVLFLKRKAIKRRFGTLALIAAFMLFGGVSLTAYAAEQDTEPDILISDIETEPEADAEPDIVIEIDTPPDEVITGEEIEIDIFDLLDPDYKPPTLSPPGNLTLVDDFSGEDSEDKQFITVVTKNGNYFYIIIDRAGNRDNVHFLNLVDEADLFALLAELEETETSKTSPQTNEPPEQNPEPREPSEPERRQNNNTQLIIMLLVIAAVGGGAFYWFKVKKPKQSANNAAPLPELDEFDFDADEDDFIIEQDGGDFDDIPDFSAEPEEQESEDGE